MPNRTCAEPDCVEELPLTGRRGRPRKWCDRHRPRYQDSLSRPCGVEGCDRPHRAKGLCSMHWRRKAREEGREAAPAWDDRRRHNYHARRARIAAASVADEPVLLADIAERDGWTCGLCAALVDPDLKYPHPMSPSLDHTVPLALGGAHAPGNVALSHLVCNISKGARVAA